MSASAGRCSTMGPWPTTPRVVFDVPALLKMRPKTSRNISAKKVKNRAVRSRKNPRSMARASVISWIRAEATEAVAGGVTTRACRVVLMRGTPVP
ncbi:MAG TPA: hypothetical protein VI248_04085 [Kineosporiaceae bacterium]